MNPPRTALTNRWIRTFLGIGSIGPLGHLPASGTVTVAVVGLPVYWATRGWPIGWYVISVTVFALVSVALHQTGDRLLGESDSRRLVWDELVGYFMAVTGVPFTWPLVVASFFLERGIDILKIPPGRQIEDHAPGGWGVVGDDVVAGMYTCVILHVLMAVAPAWVGVG